MGTRIAGGGSTLEIPIPRVKCESSGEYFGVLQNPLILFILVSAGALFLNQFIPESGRLFLYPLDSS